MRTIILSAIVVFVSIAATAQTFSYNDSTKIYTVKGSLADSYMIYGYDKPDKKSQKVILFSSYPTQTTNNPYHMPLGSYAETVGLKRGDKIEFVSEKKGFAKMNFISSGKTTIFYLPSGYVMRE